MNTKRVRWSRRILVVPTLFFLVFLFAPRVAQVYVDSLWFNSLGYMELFWSTFWIKFALFAGFFTATYALLRGAFWRMDRLFSGYALGGTFVRFDNQPVDFEPERFMKPLAVGTALAWAFISGISMSMRWQLFALALQSNGASDSAAGALDPIFGRPLGFYLFVWPVRQMLASWLCGIAIIIFLATLIYLFFAYASRMPTVIVAEARRTAYRASSLALALVLCAYAWRAHLSRYSQLWRDHELFTGIGYVQHHVLLPGLVFVALTLVVAAALAVANAFVWQKPRVLIGALALPAAAYIGLGLVSNYVENFIVKPNELERETPYIKSNIDSTRRAFGLDRVTSREFPARRGVENLALEKNSLTLENIRLWDWQALQASLRQNQQGPNYYDFPDVDVDRYRIGGQMRQVMVAARELDVEKLPPTARNWVNNRLVYTHGYGVTMNTANGFEADGRPRYLLSDMPVRSSAPNDINVSRPQIYFGQKTDSDVYVRTRQKEFDYPQGATVQTPAKVAANATSANATSANATSASSISATSASIANAATPASGATSAKVSNTAAETTAAASTAAETAAASTAYAGSGGIELGGFLRRTVLAWTLGDLSRLPFSNDVTPQTRVLMHRNIRERATRIAPFLSYDNDPYLVVRANGHLSWIMDAYTSSLYFPYSRHYPLSDGNWTNYLRNSVKVVIDAYDGTVDFYNFDSRDPIAAAYGKVFPGLFKPASEMPADLRAHLRYPEQLFRAQAEVYGLYHIQDVSSFFRRQDAWSIASASASSDSATPQNPFGPGAMPGVGSAPSVFRPSGSTRSTAPPIDPYFVLMRLPGESPAQEFVPILPFTPLDRDTNNMVGWLAGRSDGAANGDLISYTFPKATQPPDGPAQVDARINKNRDLAKLITFWNQQKSSLLRGNMLVLPVGQGLLYVQPLYLQADAKSSPEIALVILATQDDLAWGTTFKQALLNLTSGTPATESITEAAARDLPANSDSGTSTTATSDPNTARPTIPDSAPLDANRRQLIDRAAADLDAYQKLTSAGRYSEAGQRLESLKKNLDQLRRAKN